MTGRARKYLLSGYLAVAMAGIVYTLNRRHELLALLLSMTAQHQSLSWPMVASMVAFILTFAAAVFFSAPINPLFYLAAGYLFGFATGSVLAIMANILGSGTSLYLFRKTTSPPPALQRHEVKNVFLTLVLLRCSPWFPQSAGQRILRHGACASFHVSCKHRVGDASAGVYLYPRRQPAQRSADPLRSSFTRSSYGFDDIEHDFVLGLFTADSCRR